MRKMTITEALNELKLYDSKINKTLNDGVFIGSKKKSVDICNHMNVKKFNESALASYQRAVDYIANRNKLKSLIVQSNATTMISVNGESMTVAECIERKNSIEYQVNLLNVLKQQYTKETSTVEKNNTKVDTKIDELLVTLVGKDTDKKLTKEDTEAIERPYREKNEFELVDPIHVVDKIDELDSYISGFLSNCDTALVLSNATTFIEVDF